MPPEFDEAAQSAAARLIDLALAEDLGDAGDLTSQALIGEDERAAVEVVARKPGVLAGGPVAKMVCDRFPPLVWDARLSDGSPLEIGTVAAVVSGPLRSLLTSERTMLNFLTHLSGIATLTRQFVDLARGTPARIHGAELEAGIWPGQVQRERHRAAFRHHLPRPQGRPRANDEGRRVQRGVEGNPEPALAVRDGVHRAVAPPIPHPPLDGSTGRRRTVGTEDLPDQE